MEQLLLTCLQAQMIIKNISIHRMLSDEIKTELIMEVRKITKKSCNIDAKAD